MELLKITPRNDKGRGEDLAAAYEQTVRRADDLSDRLRREANRVASRATLQAQQLSLQQQTVELGRQQVSALNQLRQIDAQWRQAWQPLGIDPLPPREMQAWIQRQHGLVQQAQTIRQRTASLEQLEEQIAADCRQLRSVSRGFRPRPMTVPNSRRSTPCWPAAMACWNRSRRRRNRGGSWSARRTGWRRR